MRPRMGEFGEFLAWLALTREHLLAGGTANVPCGDCTACCRSSYFIHLQPEDTQALAHIPTELLFPAPGLPAGHQVLGFNAEGHCPMLVAGRCSIYAHRPQTCRAFDCRVFAACNIEPMGAAVAAQAKRWRLSPTSEDARHALAALRAVAQFLRERASSFAAGAPSHPSQVALAALKAYPVFLKYHAAYEQTGTMPADSEIAAAIVRANTAVEN